MKKIRSGFVGIIALLSANIGFKDFCTKFHMRVMVKKVLFMANKLWVGETMILMKCLTWIFRKCTNVLYGVDWKNIDSKPLPFIRRRDAR